MVPLLSIIMLLCLVIPCAVGGGIFMLPAVLIIPFSHRFYRKYMDAFQAAWFFIPVYFMEHVYGVKVVLWGDIPQKQDRLIYMMNHRCRIDWMFLWIFNYFCGEITRFRIVLKDGLKNIPFLGWAMQMFTFVFLSRSWENDQTYLHEIFSLWKRTSQPIQMLIFPEGTDLSPSNKEKSKQFSESRGLQVFDYVLHPKTKGIWTCIDILKDHLDAIYDLTIAYVDRIPIGEADVLNGIYPKEVHILIKRFPIMDIPVDHEKDFSAWVHQRWVIKEQNLKEFYEGQNRFESPNPSSIIPLFDMKQIFLISSFWITATSACLYLLWISPLARIHILCGYVICYLVSKYIGFEIVEARLQEIGQKIFAKNV